MDNRYGTAHILRPSSLTGGSRGDADKGVDVARSWSNVADGARRRVAGTRWGQPRVLFEMALGVSLVLGGAVGVVAWQRSSTEPVTVVVAERDLQRGHTVTSADLTTATLVGARGVLTMSPAEADELIGATLMVEVAAGTAMYAGMVEYRTAPGPGEALVSVALRPGETPIDLAQQDVVRLVSVRLDPLGAAPPAVTYDTAEVWSVRPPTDLDPTTLVTLRAAAGVMERLALADRVRLGVIAP